jgi:hypothetical protein
VTGHLPAETGRTATSFTIFEGTSEIQRMIIGRAVAGLDVRRSVEKHVGNIFSKLGLAPSDADHRRVLAVLRYLES